LNLLCLFLLDTQKKSKKLANRGIPPFTRYHLKNLLKGHFGALEKSGFRRGREKHRSQLIEGSGSERGGLTSREIKKKEPGS